MSEIIIKGATYYESFFSIKVESEGRIRVYRDFNRDLELNSIYALRLILEYLGYKFSSGDEEDFENYSIEEDSEKQCSDSNDCEEKSESLLSDDFKNFKKNVISKIKELNSLSYE